MGQIRELQAIVYENAVVHGFHDKPRTVGDGLMLIVTEVAEAMEAHREGHDCSYTDCVTHKPEGLPSEIADTVIRCMDLAGQMGFDLETEVLRKIDYNRTRERLHGGKQL